MFGALASPSWVASGKSLIRLTACAFLLTPAIALPALGRGCADRLASAIAVELGVLAAPLSAHANAHGVAVGDPASDEPRDEEAVWRRTPGLGEAVEFEDTPPRLAASGASGRARNVRKNAATRASEAGAPRNLRISAAQVLALAARRAIPKASPVKANARHPAGLLLQGVSALGVGLRDGDVLTEAAGQPVTSVGAVIGIVMAARARGRAEISGRLYRAGTPFVITVEQPYPKPRDF